MDLKSLEEIREALLRLKNIPCGATVTTDSSMLAWDAILTARSSSEEGGSSSGISGMEFETESIRSEDKLTVADIKALFRVMGQHATDLDIDKLIAKSEEDFPQFLELLTSVIGDPSPSEDEMRKAFKVFDSRGKGFVSFEEMEFAVNKFMSSNENELENTGGNPPAYTDAVDSVVTVPELEDMFSVTNTKRNSAEYCSDEKSGVNGSEMESEGHKTVGTSSQRTMTVEDFIDAMKIIF